MRQGIPHHLVVVSQTYYFPRMGQWQRWVNGGRCSLRRWRHFSLQSQHQLLSYIYIYISLIIDLGSILRLSLESTIESGEAESSSAESGAWLQFLNEYEDF